MTKSKLLSLCFILCLFISAQAQSASPAALQNIQNCFGKLDANNNFGESLNQLDLNYLPMGIKKTINNMDITLAVSGGEIHTGYTSLDIFLRIVIPQKQTTLFFGAKDIKMTHAGDLVGDAKVILMGDIDIPLGGNITLRLKGSFDENTGRSEELTFASIDCNGFKDLGITAEVQLDTALCVVTDPNGNIIPDQKVVGKFSTQVTNWSDIMAQVSFPTFMIKGLDGFLWTVKDAIFDFSDLQTPQGIFPEKYKQYLIPGQENLWRGVYVNEFAITLPEQFSGKGGKRTSFNARNMIIDENGVTGTFGVDGSLLTLGEGDASGWSFSVERFALILLANNLEGAEFGGEIGLPISEKTTLRYDGFIGAGNKYALQVQAVDSLSFDFLGATAQIDPNSYVKFTVENKKFRPEAMLHGRMGIMVKMDPKDDKELANFKGVEFRSLHIKTIKPYLSVEYFGYKGEVKLMNFPLSISDIGLTASDNQASLGFNVKLSIGDVFTGETRLEIVGKMDGGVLHKWKYDHVAVSQIKLDAEIAETFYLKGRLDILRADPIYGDGFRGEIEMGFTKVLEGLKVQVRAMFGKTDFRYWFVDGLASLPGTGIAVYPSLFLTGFGGGITYKMKPDLSKSGASLSSTSITYVPDAKSSLGVKASVMFAVVDRKTVNGEATFELAFNDKGGLSYAGFYGYAKFLGALPDGDNFQKSAGSKYTEVLSKEQEFAQSNNEEKLKQLKQYNPNEAANATTDKSKIEGENGIMATVAMQFNFVEASFHASFEMYVSMLGGFMRGAGQNNRAGYAVLHIDKRDWYVHIGTPTDRIGLKMGIGKISAEAGAYLMVGTNIPATPGVPPQVAAILGEEPANLDYMGSLNSLGAGNGFAFGSNLSVSTGDLTFLILYANFGLGLGFDMMLKDYGNAQCKGRSGAIGMDGWYANGQAYAYFHGELGVKVNLLFIKAKFPIITADFAALMQAMLPNPSSFKAYVAAKASLLNGLVNVNCRFKVSVGDECELVAPGESPLDMAMINEVSPSNGAGEVSVFTAPQAAFNMPIEKAFNVQDDEGEKTYRVILRSFTLNPGISNVANKKAFKNNITGELKWNKEKNAVSFYSHEILPPQQEITATVKVVFEEWKNNRWNPVFTAGEEAVEERTVRFTTSDAPNEIPAQNIVYSYPVIDQKYYLKSESSKGYIQLQFGQSYLFPTDLKNQVVYQDERGNRQAVDFVYNEGSKRIEYNIPSINNKTAYTLQIISLNQNAQATVQNTATNSLLTDSELGSIDIHTKRAVAETRTDVGATLLTYEFAASAYNTFREKIQAIRPKEAIVEKISSDVYVFRYETETMEPFDIAELAGTDRTENKPLISVSAALDEYYYREKMYPLLYREYPAAGLFKVKRYDAEEIGVPPAKAIPVISTYLSKVENNDFTGIAKNLFPYRYDLPIYYKADLIDLQSQVLSAYVKNTDKRIDASTYAHFVNATFPFISAGQYKINLQYIMPGEVKGTSGTFEYRNFIQ